MQVIEQLKGLADEHFLAIYETLAQDGFGPLDGEVAKAMKFRPHMIKRVPMAQRARRAKHILSQTGNAELAYEMFGAYLMKRHKELITTFLDETGVPHDEGMIENIESAKPEGGKINAAVAKLDETHDPLDVTLYLAMCAEQWPNVPEVETAWRLRAGAPG
jgi:hypothetical protein